MKAQIKRSHMKMRPDPWLVAVAAADNWTFLVSFRSEEQTVDFFHAIPATLPTMRSRPTTSCPA